MCVTIETNHIVYQKLSSVLDLHTCHEFMCYIIKKSMLGICTLVPELA